MFISLCSTGYRIPRKLSSDCYGIWDFKYTSTCKLVVSSMVYANPDSSGRPECSWADKCQQMPPLERTKLFPGHLQLYGLNPIWCRKFYLAFMERTAFICEETGLSPLLVGILKYNAFYHLTWQGSGQCECTVITCSLLETQFQWNSSCWLQWRNSDTVKLNGV